MKELIFTIMLALAIFAMAVWLLQTAAKNSAPRPLRQQLRQTPPKKSDQDEIDLGEIKLNNVKPDGCGEVMTHSEIFEIFESLDIDEIVMVLIRLPNLSCVISAWIINEVHLEDEGLYVSYFPFKRAELQLAFIPMMQISTQGIIAVKRA